MRVGPAIHWVDVVQAFALLNAESLKSCFFISYCKCKCRTGCSVLHLPTDIENVLSACPPAMAATIAERLYGRSLSTVPLFAGLSTDVISAL